MAMSMGSGGEDAALSEINTTPLVDVMLVLLIIFLITIPAVLQTPNVALPDIAYEPTLTKPENVLLSIRGSADGSRCEVFWENTAVNSNELLERGQEKLRVLLEQIGGPENITEDNFPEVHIRGDVNTPWRCVGGVIYTMQFAGFQKIGFISQPSGASTVSRL
jgi:biopolymer transport protein ExbD